MILYGIVLAVHIVLALFLVIIVLLQGGRGGLGETLGGAAAQSLFGGGANTVMTRLTTVCAAMFMVTSLSMAILSTARGRSVMEQLEEINQQFPGGMPLPPMPPMDEQSQEPPSQDKPAASVPAASTEAAPPLRRLPANMLPRQPGLPKKESSSTAYSLPWRAFFLAALTLVLFSFCPFVFSQPPVAGDALVEGSIGDASRLLPLLVSDSASADIAGLVFNGLLKYNERLEVVGDLAESWSVSEDGLTLTFVLRPNLKWHDGEPVTPEDVLFTYQKLVDPEVHTPFASNYDSIEKVEVIDARTIRVHYREVFAPALESWMIGIIPKHLLEHEDLNTTPFLRKPVGQGPYRFIRWKTGELIELAANPDYYEHRPFLDRYLYRIIPDQTTLFLELLTQGVDLGGLTPLQYKRQTSSRFVQKAFQKFRYPSFGFTFLAYNLSDARFSDWRVRQAINLAIDKQAIVEGVLFGLGQVATGPYPKESWAYNPEIQPAAPDLSKAKELLRQAGWQDHDGDGILDKQGVAFGFTILTNQGNEPRRQTAELIQRQLQQLGISVKIRIVEWSVFIHEFVDKKHFDAILLGWNLSRDPDLYDIFHSSKTKEGEYNFIGYANPEVDRLLEQGRRTFDKDKRAEIYRRVHALLYQDQAYTFLYIPDSLPIVSSRIRNIVPTPIGIGYNLIDWYVPRSEQRYHAVMSQ